MNEKEFETFLSEGVYAIASDAEILGFNPLPLEEIEVSTFEDAGVMTMNKGLVVRLADGSEFQVTIVQSQRARE